MIYTYTVSGECMSYNACWDMSVSQVLSSPAVHSHNTVATIVVVVATSAVVLGVPLYMQVTE